MAKVQKECRICGRMYTPCSYCENDKMAFHYRTICCSRECAQIYLTRVLEERSTSSNITSNPSKESESLEEVKTIDCIEHKKAEQVEEEKPKRKYTKKKKIEVEDREQIEESVGTSG